MSTNEKVINGNLYFYDQSQNSWVQYSTAQLTKRIQDLEEKLRKVSEVVSPKAEVQPSSINELIERMRIEGGKGKEFHPKFNPHPNLPNQPFYYKEPNWWWDFTPVPSPPIPGDIWCGALQHKP